MLFKNLISINNKWPKIRFLEKNSFVINLEINKTKNAKKNYKDILHKNQELTK